MSSKIFIEKFRPKSSSSNYEKLLRTVITKNFCDGNLRIFAKILFFTCTEISITFPQFFTKTDFLPKFLFWPQILFFDQKVQFWTKVSILDKSFSFGQKFRFFPIFDFFTENIFFGYINEIYDIDYPRKLQNNGENCSPKKSYVWQKMYWPHLYSYTTLRACFDMHGFGLKFEVKVRR